MPLLEAFKPNVLTKSVNLVKPATTLVLDIVFATKEASIYDVIKWDVETGSEEILDNISVHAEAQMEDNEGFKTITIDPTRFSKKKLITAADLGKIRERGSLAPAFLNRRVGREQRTMRAKVDRTREFMACTLISTGKVIDRKGKVLVNYGLPAATYFPTLGATAKWNTDTGQPLKDVRKWKKTITKGVGAVDRFVAFIGSDAMDALLGNPNALELLKYTIGNQIATEGRVRNFANVEIYEYDGTYIDKNKVETDLIPPDSICLVGLVTDAAAEQYVPVVDFDAATGVGKNEIPEMFFSKMWPNPDPSGHYIKVEARPMPILYKPKCIVCAKVV